MQLTFKVVFIFFFASYYLAIPLPEDVCIQRIEQFINHRLPSIASGSIKKPADYRNGDFVFFLHVPRTAGRTFWSCFLYRAFPPSARCAKSYDILRLDLSRPDCKLLASHDDYSVTDFLPHGHHVITQVRDPVDRVISAYEFSVISTAREFSPNVTMAPDKSPRVKTRDVWPWIYLIQLFDRYTENSISRLFSRYKEYKTLFPKEADAKLDRWVKTVSAKSGRSYYYHRRTRESRWNLTEEEMKFLLPTLDPYNTSLILPLASFLEFPMADELVHNAMTYQVLGLTNISFWPEAKEIRECATYSKKAQEKLLSAAKAQMDGMLHISLTSKLDQSLRSIAVRHTPFAPATLKLGLRNHTYSGEPPMLNLTNSTKTDLTIEDAQGNFSNISDSEIMALLEKYRSLLEDNRLYARSRRRTQLSKTEFLPIWDSAIAKLEIVKDLQVEVMRRRKEKGFEFYDYPDSPDDSKKILKMPLWFSYKKCVNKTTRDTKFSKIKSMSNLALPDERRAHFTSEARNNIAQSTVDRIKEKNWMDMELYKYSKQLYETYLDYQSSRGLLEKLPVYRGNQTETKPPDPPQPIIHDEL